MRREKNIPPQDLHFVDLSWKSNKFITDAEMGLYYYRSRYYNPATGRFLSEDPISFAGADANLYRYVGNSPTNYLDPYGLQNIRTEANPRKDAQQGLIYSGTMPGTEADVGKLLKKM